MLRLTDRSAAALKRSENSGKPLSGTRSLQRENAIADVQGGISWGMISGAWMVR